MMLTNGCFNFITSFNDSFHKHETLKNTEKKEVKTKLQIDKGEHVKQIVVKKATAWVVIVETISSRSTNGVAVRHLLTTAKKV